MSIVNLLHANKYKIHADEVITNKVTTFSSSLDMDGKGITNMAQGTSDNDAVNMSQLNDAVDGVFRSGDTINITGITSDNNHVAMNSKELRDLAEPTQGGSAATKRYVDGLVQGLDVKDSVYVASDSDLAANASVASASYSSNQFSITLHTADTLTFDDYDVGPGHRVLLKDQSNAVQNGVYTVSTLSGTSAVLSRSSDFTSPNLTSGAFVFVEHGTKWDHSGFVLAEPNGNVNTGSDSIFFSRFSGTGNITAGNGLSKSHDTLYVNVKPDSGVVIDNDQLAVDLGHGLIQNRLPISKVQDGSVNSTEFNHLAGVTGNIQTQLDAKATTAALNGLDANLQSEVATLNAALDTKLTPDNTATLSNKTISDANNTLVVNNASIQSGVDAAKIGSGTVNNTEFGHLDGVTSSIQSQLDSKTTTSYVDSQIATCVNKANPEMTGGITIHSSIGDGHTRPALTDNSTIGDYEVVAHHGTTMTDGAFMRVRAGAGTNPNGASYIDLSAWNSNSDLDRNVVIGAGGAEKLRIGVSESSMSQPLNMGSSKITNLEAGTNAADAVNLSQLASKAEQSYVDAQVAPKADTSYVDAQVATKADTSYVDAQVATKADASYVDAQVAAVTHEADLTGGITVNGGLTNTSTRPATTDANTRHAHEIRGISSGGAGNDDGFLRLVAGGGTNTFSSAHIDLSGYSTVPDMDNNITFSVADSEKMRVDNTEIKVNEDLNMTTHKVKNVASGTDPSDAVNVAQLSTKLDAASSGDITIYRGGLEKLSVRQNDVFINNGHLQLNDAVVAGLRNPSQGDQAVSLQYMQTYLTNNLQGGNGITITDVDGIKTLSASTDVVTLSEPQTLQSKTLTSSAIDTDVNTVTNISNADIKPGAAIDASKIANGSVSNAKYQALGLLDLSKGDIQTQINNAVQYKTGSTDPTSTTDESEGYSNGDLYLNTTTSKLFYCRDQTENAAVWGVIDTDTDTTYSAGTGLSLSGTTFSIDSSVATLTGSQTLTNKTLSNPIISQITNGGTLTLPSGNKTVAATDDIPSAVSELTNDSGFITASSINILTNKTLTNPVIAQISNTGTLTLPTSTGTVALTSDIPSVLSSFTNDSGYITASSSNTLTNKTLTSPVIGQIINTGTLTLPTSTGTIALTSDVPSAVSELSNDSGYITASSSNTLTNKTLTNPVISQISNTGTLTLPTSTGTIALTSNIPSAVSALTNDSGYITGSSSSTLTNKTMGDQLDCNSNKIVNCADPTASQDVATKAYVDANAGGGDYVITQSNPGGVVTNMAIGASAGGNITSSDYDNIAFGYQAMENGGSFSNLGGRNMAIGSKAFQGFSDGYFSTAVGTEAAKTGNFTASVCIGFSAGGGSSNATTRDRNTCVGYGSGWNAPYNNITCIGAQSNVTGSNQVQLGNSDTTTYVYGTVQNRSDARDKADIRDCTHGLNFIKHIRPVEFKWDLRSDYDEQTYVGDHMQVTRRTKDGSKKRNRYHCGVIAQEVENYLQANGKDWGGLQHHSVNGGEDVYSIGYDEFIGPLIKAVQELSAKVEALEDQLSGNPNYM